MTTTKTGFAPAKPASLGSNYEIMRRFSDFAVFWRENPVSARFALQSEARDLLPKERVKRCMRARIKSGEPVDVWKASALNSAHYGNLQVCASIWHCPVCASKIATRRREEITAAIDTWTGSGNSILLPTFTMQHFAHDGCADVLQGIATAHHKFWSDRLGRALASEFGIIGKIRGLEVTYTFNGWHWHFHVLLFVAGHLAPNLINDLRLRMSEHWRNVVSRSGYFADSEHGLDLRITDKDVADYVSKMGKEGEGSWRNEAADWTEAHEIALASIKRAGQGGKTPFQLLALAMSGDNVAKRLFVEYAKTVKGKRQLHWSKGLRANLGLLPEKTDQELSEEQEERAMLMARLEHEHWAAILANDARGELLKVAATGDVWALVDWLESLGIRGVNYPQLIDNPEYYGQRHAL